MKSDMFKKMLVLHRLMIIGIIAISLFVFTSIQYLMFSTMDWIAALMIPIVLIIDWIIIKLIDKRIYRLYNDRLIQYADEIATSFKRDGVGNPVLLDNILEEIKRIKGGESKE